MREVASDVGQRRDAGSKRKGKRINIYRSI
jgi:hypothetical protein